MGKKLKTLGVILARGGSKGIIKKNIAMVNEKPLIAYTIEAALSSNIFDNFVVSTDCNEIASVAEAHGASVPFMRPDALAQDHTWSRDALQHAVLESEKVYNCQYDYIFELPCVAPLRKARHIREVYDIIVGGGCDSVTSYTRVEDKHPVRMKRMVNGYVEDFCSEFPEGEGSRRQDLEPCYIRNGAIYAMTRDCIVNQFSRHGSIAVPYIMRPEESVNIDGPMDLKLAELMIKEAAHRDL